MKPIFALLLAALVCFSPVTARADGVHGYLYDSNHRGVRGVTLTFSGAAGAFSARSNARGFYALLGLPPGVYSVYASGGGYWASTCPRMLLVEPDEVAYRDVPVAPVPRVFAHIAVCLPAGPPDQGLVDPGATADVYDIH